MINCFVRALRSRRPSIRGEGLEAMAEDKDFRVRVRSAAYSAMGELMQAQVDHLQAEVRIRTVRQRNPNAANCENGAANFSSYCNKGPEVTKR
jgi:hypothetical protein